MKRQEQFRGLYIERLFAFLLKYQWIRVGEIFVIDKLACKVWDAGATPTAAISMSIDTWEEILCIRPISLEPEPCCGHLLYCGSQTDEREIAK
jgi:hypothetical protein